MSLPSNVSTGKVSGQFVIAVGDGPDPENPTVTYPVQGKVEFQASVDYWPDPNATAPVTILSEIIEGVLDGTGRLCTPDPGDKVTPTVPWVKLIATNDPDLMVLNWTWKVTYKFLPRNGRPVAQIPAHSLAMPANAVIDLASVVKVPSSPGVGIDQVTIVAAQAFASANAAAASATAAAGSAATSAGTLASAKTYTDQQVATKSPAGHTHAYVDITGKPAAFAPTAHRHPWSELDNVPATFAPSTHSHALSDMSGRITFAQGPAMGTLGASVDLDTLITDGTFNQPLNGNATLVLNYPAAVAGKCQVDVSGSNVYQTYQAYSGNNKFWYRSKYSTNPFGAWQEFAVNAGRNAYAEAAGTAAVPIIAAGGSYSLVINFPAGRFSVAPILALNTGDGRVTVGAITASSATSATVTLNNYTAASSVAATARWQAVQMTSTTAAG